MLAGLPVLRASESPQDQAIISVAEAFAAAAGGRSEDALRCARATLAQADALGLRHEALRGAWPLAARSADELGDTATARELLSQLDSHPPGHLAPMLRAERELARARLAARSGDPAAADPFAAAISGLREHSTPITSPTAYSTMPSTCSASAITKPRRPRSAKPETWHSDCAAIRSWTAPQAWGQHKPRHGSKPTWRRSSGRGGPVGRPLRRW